MEDVDFQYRLADAGWAEVEFRIGRAVTELAVSHADDPLHGLITAVLAIAAGESRANAIWRSNDHGLQWWSHISWQMIRESTDVNVRITKIRRGGGGQQGGTQLTGHCTIHALRSAIAEGTNRLYLRTGLRRYEAATQSTFPVADLDRLEAITLNPSATERNPH